VIQEKRDSLKHWNMVLVILTYALVIFGTFLTRSGVLSSCMPLPKGAIGPLFLCFHRIHLYHLTGLAVVALELSENRSAHDLTFFAARPCSY